MPDGTLATRLPPATGPRVGPPGAGGRMDAPGAGLIAVLVPAVLAITTIDIQLEDGRSAVVLYILPVILSGRLPGPRHVVATAAACILLTVATYMMRHGVDVSGPWMFRRAVCLGGIVLATLLTLRNQAVDARRCAGTSLLDASADAIIVRDAAMRITWWSSGAEAVYGWSRQEAAGRGIDGLLGRLDRRACAEALSQTLRTGAWQGELRHIARNGRTVTVMSRWAARRDGGGALTAILQTDTDITLEKQAEAALLASNARHRTILDGSAAAIWEQDFAGVHAEIARLRRSGVRDFRDHFARVPACLPRMLAGIRLLDANATALALFQAEDRPALRDGFAALFGAVPPPQAGHMLAACAEGRPRWDGEMVLRTLRATPRRVLISAVFLPRDDGGGCVLTSLLDVTERWQVEQRLARAETHLAQATRVAMLGQLTRSVSDGVTRPVAAIAQAGEAGLAALRAAPPDLDAARAALETIVAAGAGAAETIARVRRFVGSQVAQPASLCFAEALGAAIELTRGEAMRRGIRLHLDIAPSLPTLVGDRARLEHVVAGMLLRRMRACRRAHPAVQVACRQREGALVLEITGTAPEDAGAAAPGRTAEDPGQDIGWRVSLATVRDHGGRIEALEGGEPGLRLVLPVTPDPAGGRR